MRFWLKFPQSFSTLFHNLDKTTTCFRYSWHRPRRLINLKDFTGKSGKEQCLHYCCRSRYLQYKSFLMHYQRADVPNSQELLMKGLFLHVCITIWGQWYSKALIKGYFDSPTKQGGHQGSLSCPTNPRWPPHLPDCIRLNVSLRLWHLWTDGLFGPLSPYTPPPNPPQPSTHTHTYLWSTGEPRMPSTLHD